MTSQVIPRATAKLNFQCAKSHPLSRLEAFKELAAREEKKNSNKRKSCTRSALSIMLAEVGHVDITEIRRVVLYEWVNSLTMKRKIPIMCVLARYNSRVALLRLSRGRYVNAWLSLEDQGQLFSGSAQHSGTGFGVALYMANF